MQLKNNLYIFISLISSLLIISIFPSLPFNKRILNTEKKDKGFDQNLIKDSIKPACVEIPINREKKDIYKLENMEILIPESRKWSTNLIKAKLSDSRNITSKYKKKFNGYVIVKTHNNEFCKFPAKIRLSGDWKDHIKYDSGVNNIASSMDINLLEGNINGIIRFKLFIPETRNGISEIITSSILKNLNYLSPYTRFIDINVNETKLKMIFQEKASKEMLEANNLRESAIIESDESMLWDMRSKSREIKLNIPVKEAMSHIIFPKTTNMNWVKRGINKKIALRGMDLYSKVIIETHNISKPNNYNSFSDNLLSNNIPFFKNKLSQYRALLLSMGAYHGLVNHNRKFYYDAINSTFLPIYYDGNPKISPTYRFKLKSYLNQIKDDNFFREIDQKNIEQTIKEIKSINKSELIKIINKSGVNISITNLELILGDIIDNLDNMRNFINKGNEDINKIFLPIKSYKLNKGNNYGIISHLSNNNYKLCEFNNQKCKILNLNEEEVLNLIEGKYKYQKINFFFTSNNKSQLFENSKKFILEDKLNSIEVITFYNPKLIINKEEKLIKVNINNLNQKILINNSFIKEWNFIINSNVKPSNKELNSRHDEKLLTGLFTINQSLIEDINISLNGSSLEDSLNIIRTEGSINNLVVNNSAYDAIDFDFSKITVNNINVKNAGNDCIDFSAGEYNIKSASIINCLDKGISLGEASKLVIDNLNVSESNIGVVSKDSSNLIIKSGTANKNNLCISAYRKKQEFNGATIETPYNFCDKKNILIQKNSRYIQNDSKN